VLLTSYGDAVDPAAVPPDQTPLAGTGPAPSSDGPPVQTGRRSGPYDLRLESVRVVAHGSGDRIVLTFTGDGRPGWAVHYVDEAVVDGSGEVVGLAGDAIVQVDVSGTPTQVSGTSRPVRRSLAGDVVDLRAVAAWEGVTQVFVGIDGGRRPFRVSVLTTPSRLVVDVGRGGSPAPTQTEGPLTHVCPGQGPFSAPPRGVLVQDIGMGVSREIGTGCVGSSAWRGVAQGP